MCGSCGPISRPGHEHRAPGAAGFFARILLIKPSAAGDVVHAVPVLAKLRRRYPGARIDWLLTPENAALVQGHPALSNIVLFERRASRRPVGGWRRSPDFSACWAKSGGLATISSSTCTGSFARRFSRLRAVRRCASASTGPSAARAALSRAASWGIFPRAAGPARGRARGWLTRIAFPFRRWRCMPWTAISGWESCSA